MRSLSYVSAAIATVLLAAVPAAAQTTGAGVPDPASLPSSVLWAAGVAAFLGFMLGSFPPNDRDAAVKFDMGGAMVWAMAAALVVGGLALYMNSGAWVPAVYGIGFGCVLALLRLVSTRPAPTPSSLILAEGVNRATGETPKARLKAAERMYNKASFRSTHNERYFATRGRDWRFGAGGADARSMSILADAATRPSEDTFAILVVLVKDLPGEADQPAVIVVRGGANIVQVKVEQDGMTVPGFDKKIPASSISGTVGYAWR